MTDIFAPEKRSEIMKKIKSKNTKLEIKFLKALLKEFPEAEVEYQPVVYIGKRKIRADFRVNGILVFLDSCFWHGCPIHFKLPKTNTEFWKKHIEDNIKRDAEVSRLLKENGIPFVRIWEHDFENGNWKEILKKAFFKWVVQNGLFVVQKFRTTA